MSNTETESDAAGPGRPAPPCPWPAYAPSRPRAAPKEDGLSSGDADAAADEDAAYDKRAEESKAAGIDLQTIRPPQGGDPPPPGNWQWTLNWDPVLPGVIIGSCPRAPADVARLAKEAGVEAIVCLQSEVCAAPKRLARRPA